MCPKIVSNELIRWIDHTSWMMWEIVFGPQTILYELNMFSMGCSPQKLVEETSNVPLLMKFMEPANSQTSCF